MLFRSTGKLKWHFQPTPHDEWDWDAVAPVVLVDSKWKGQDRKLLLQANRNGFLYVMDRTDGKLLLAKPFLKKLNWAEAIGKDGRPILNDLKENAMGETYVCPGFQGDTNPHAMMLKGGSLHGIFVGNRAMFEDMNRAIEINDIHPVVDKVFTFSQVVEAFQYQMSQAHFGKVVLTIG